MYLSTTERRINPDTYCTIYIYIYIYPGIYIYIYSFLSMGATNGCREKAHTRFATHKFSERATMTKFSYQTRSGVDVKPILLCKHPPAHGVHPLRKTRRTPGPRQCPDPPLRRRHRHRINNNTIPRRWIRDGTLGTIGMQTVATFSRVPRRFAHPRERTTTTTTVVAICFHLLRRCAYHRFHASCLEAAVDAVVAVGGSSPPWPEVGG